MLSERSKIILKRLNKRKYIPLSHGGQLRGADISGFRPIIEHPHFQALKYRRQLSNAQIVFPDANHTRFLHSIDALCWQKNRSEFWTEYEMISPEDALHLNVFTLLHDIGHGPMSHVLDRVCSMSHDRNGERKIAEMKNEIESCGVDFQRIQNLFGEKDPLYKSVMHHPLGTDKFSYLSLDARHCAAGAPDLGRLPSNVFWLDGRMLAHIKCLYEALELKRFYVKMYRDVYFRKPCLIGQRVIEKEIYRLLASGKIGEPALWELTDEELTALIRKIPRGRQGLDRYQRLESKCAVAFKLEGFGWTENTCGKHTAVLERDKSFFDALAGNSSPAILNAKENELAAIIGTTPFYVDIVPPMALYRFAPPAIDFANGEEIFSDEKLARNAEAIRELAGACLVLRVCVPENLRLETCKKAALVSEFFDDWAAKLSKSG